MRVGFGFGHVYDRPVIFSNHTTVSFNGGRGGLTFRPTDRDRIAMRDRHVAPTVDQRSHQGFAGQNRDQFAKFNNGRPPVAAAASSNAFHDHPTDPAAAAQPSRNTRGNSNQPQPNNQPQQQYQPRNNGQQPQAQPQQQPRPDNQPRTQPQPEQQQPRQQPQPQQRPQAQPRQDSRPAPAPHDDKKPDTHEQPK